MEEKDVLAHIYVRHFGDMHGGQIIKRNLPPTDRLEQLTPESTSDEWTNLYTFENKYELIKNVRNILTLDMAGEANLCFKFAMDLFEDLEKHFDL